MLSVPTSRQRIVAAPTPGLCLDYANTRYWRGQTEPTETLTGFEAWLRWLEAARVVCADTAASLRALQRADAGAAGQLLGEALQAREALYGWFSAAARGEPPGEASSRWLALLDAAPARHALQLGGGPGDAPGWRVPMVTPSTAEVLAAVLWSAADLSLAGRVRLRLCDNAQCRWLFVDDSKGGTRRWCSMSACGNRAKVQRHYQRHAARAAAPG